MDTHTQAWTHIFIVWKHFFTDRRFIHLYRQTIHKHNQETSVVTWRGRSANCTSSVTVCLILSSLPISKKIWHSSIKYYLLYFHFYSETTSTTISTTPPSSLTWLLTPSLQLINITLSSAVVTDPPGATLLLTGNIAGPCIVNKHRPWGSHDYLEVHILYTIPSFDTNQLLGLRCRYWAGGLEIQPSVLTYLGFTSVVPGSDDSYITAKWITGEQMEVCQAKL